MVSRSHSATGTHVYTQTCARLHTCLRARVRACVRAYVRTRRCSNQIDMPPCESKAVFRDKLLRAAMETSFQMG